MTELSQNFTSIKQQLSSLSSNSEQMQEKLNHINQTRNKINSEVISLTKDYDRRIKELQGKLEEAVNRNQVLSKQNLLYRKDIEAFQARLIEKEKLISMLIIQQNERFGDSILARSKSEHGEKGFKKNYENMLPKNINAKEEVKAENPATKAHEEEPKQPEVPRKVSEDKPEVSHVQEQQSHSFTKSVPPPPPKTKKKSNPVPPEIKPKNSKEPEHEPTHEEIPQVKELKEQKESKPLEQEQKELSVDEQNIKEQQKQESEKAQEEQKRPRNVPPPPPPAKRPKTVNPPPKKGNVKTFHQQFLEDQKQQPRNDKVEPQPQQLQIMEPEKSLEPEQQSFPEQKETQPVVKNDQLKQEDHPEIPQDSQQTQIQSFTAPREKKMVKPKKKKAKTAIKSIDEANFNEEVSNSLEDSQHNTVEGYHGQSSQFELKPSIEYDANPSSEDFFAHFGTSAPQSQNDFVNTSKTKNSHMMEAQQSSIDYADSHSVVSSTAANMLDSQYIPEDLQGPVISSELKKMPKKKNAKREIKQLDPGSFQ